MLDKLLARFKMDRKPSHTASAIELTEGGFIFQSSREIIRWSEIEAVVGFKQDLLTTDLICLHLDMVSSNGTRSIEINEEMPGFDRFEERMAAILPNALKDWKEKVVQPAFATNTIVIFKRP